MSKGECYQKILEELKRIELYPPVSDFEPQRGNLAYFIESYYDTDKWNDLYSNIMEKCAENNRNEVCWIIVSNIIDKCEKEWKEVSEKQNDYNDLMTSKKLLTEQYNDNGLDTIDLLDMEYYPDWFLKVDKIIDWVKKDN